MDSISNLWLLDLKDIDIYYVFFISIFFVSFMLEIHQTISIFEDKREVVCLSGIISTFGLILNKRIKITAFIIDETVIQ